MEELLAEDSLESINAKKFQELLEFEEIRSDKDLIYWMNYEMYFGTLHLHNPTHGLSYV